MRNSLLTMMLAAAALYGFQAPRTPRPKPYETGWVSLFNGKDRGGWNHPRHGDHQGLWLSPDRQDVQGFPSLPSVQVRGRGQQRRLRPFGFQIGRAHV